MIISIQDLKFAYQAPVLDIEKFEMQSSEKTFLQGPSGSGKSTLLNLVSGVTQIQEGEIRIDGSDFSTLSSSKRDKIRGAKIGYIFQNFNLIPYLSVKENIELPCTLSQRKPIKQTLEEESNYLIESLGLTPQKNQKVFQLSLGQQQRVAAARALMGAPKLIIADEPTSSLDYDRAQDFMDLLFGLIEKNKLALLFVSHDDRLKDRFDRAVNLLDINRSYGQ